MKECKYCLKGHKQDQCSGKDKTYNKCNKIDIFPVNVDHPTGHRVKVNRYRGCCRGNQLQQTDQNKIKQKSYPGQSPYIS